MSSVSAAPKPFKGCLVKLNGNQSLPNAVVTIVDWVLAVYDTDNFADIGGANPERLTVPAGVKKVRVSARVAITNSQSIHGRIKLNGGDGYAGGAWITCIAQKAIFTTGIIEVAEGDYFTFDVFQSSGSNLNNTHYTWMCLEVID